MRFPFNFVHIIGYGVAYMYKRSNTTLATTDYGGVVYKGNTNWIVNVGKQRVQ